MSIATQIKHELNLPAFVVQGYVGDLTDDEIASMEQTVQAAYGSGE